MAKNQTQANAARAVAGLRKSGRIGQTNARNKVGGRSGMATIKSAGGERGATKSELRNLKRTISRSFQRRQGIGLSGSTSH